MLPVLVTYADAVALTGAYIMIRGYTSIGVVAFNNAVASAIGYLDIFSSLIKSALFGFAIGAVGCYSGYHSENGTTGVGRAANTAVVVSMIIIFIIDLIVVQIVNLMRYGT
jgi:phospholipid/cholesterol/gamma-HCH transport system permease protein